MRLKSAALTICLTIPGSTVEELIGNAETLFKPVLEELLRDTGHLLTRSVAEAVCRQFICECFARFGQQVAKTVAGQLAPSYLMRCTERAGGFRRSSRRLFSFSWKRLRSLGTRCLAFHSSTTPADVQLKFSLTQGFYFAQLLGLERGDIDPFVEQALDGSVLYLDTNVLMLGLFKVDGFVQLFDEIVKVANGSLHILCGSQGPQSTRCGE